MMDENMNPHKLAHWSMWIGCLAVLVYIVAFVLLWQGGNTIFGERLDHKDLYYAGTGLLYIAIWMKLGAIFLK